MTVSGTVIAGADADETNALAARWVADLAQRRTVETGRFTIALSGGETPQAVYQLLAAEPFRSQLRWDAWHVYFGDERACPPTDPQSNYRAAKESLLDRVPIPTSQVHRMAADQSDLDAAAAEYAALLSSTLPAGPAGAPRFDCVLLGLGADGHTASLFPSTPALTVEDTWCTRGRAPTPPVDRMSLTLPTINAAGAVAFHVIGEDKAEAMRGVAAGTVPAALVCPRQGELTWFLDQAAAGRVRQNRLPLPGSL